MKNLIVFVIFAIVGWQAYEWFQARQVVHADGQRFASDRIAPGISLPGRDAFAEQLQV